MGEHREQRAEKAEAEVKEFRRLLEFGAQREDAAKEFHKKAVARAEKAEAGVERLQEECQRWAELRIQHNEQYHKAVWRAEKAEARIKKLEKKLGSKIKEMRSLGAVIAEGEKILRKHPNDFALTLSLKEDRNYLKQLEEEKL